MGKLIDKMLDALDAFNDIAPWLFITAGAVGTGYFVIRILMME